MHALLVVVAVVLAAVAWRVVPVFTGPAMPSEATRLHIATQRPVFVSGCTTAALAPAIVATEGDELILIGVESGATIAVVWPAGFGAWRIDGRAVVADPWGGVVGREGDIVTGLGGGSGTDGAFYICPFGIPTRP